MEQARAFARDEVLPIANELDPQKGLIPESLLARIAELGYFGITIPREHGGLGLGAFEYCMVAEELARAWMSVASIIARAQGLGTGLSDEARSAELLARSARGAWIGAIALSEPDAGSDLAGVQTRAVREGDEWVITRPQALVRQRRGGRLHPGARAHSRSRRGRTALGRPADVARREEARRLPGRAHRHADRQDRLPRLPDVGPGVRRRSRPGDQRGHDRAR